MAIVANACMGYMSFGRVDGPPVNAKHVISVVCSHAVYCSLDIPLLQCYLGNNRVFLCPHVSHDSSNWGQGGGLRLREINGRHQLKLFTPLLSLAWRAVGCFPAQGPRID